MPLPILKLGIVVVRTFSRPVNRIITRRMKETATQKECNFYHWWGMKAYTLDNWIERNLS